MKYVKILFAIALVFTMCSAFSLKKDHSKPVYAFGISASFTDTVVYFTEIQILDSVSLSKEGFLALLKVKEKLDYSRPDKLKALVMKATSNKCMDYYRKASSRQESYTIDDEENAYEPVDEKSNPEARILRMEEEKYQKLVLNRLRKRNPMNYDILVKTKFQELSAAEVASEYGITPNNVNNRNLRSKAWIIEEMEKICRQSHR